MIETKKSSESEERNRIAQGHATEQPIAAIELDRFCSGCGYNLRSLPVVRDSRTQIPIVRCTECGRYQSANDAATVLRPWLDRASMLVLGAWMIGLVAVYFLLGLAECSIRYGVLEELTVHQGTQIQRINGTTIRTWTGGSGSREVRQKFPDDRWFLGGMGLLSILSAGLSGLIAVVVFPHWRRFAYVLLVVLWPTLGAIIVSLIWRDEAPHLLDWGLTYILAYTAVQVAAGLVAIAIGRKFARLMVRVFLPASIRPRLAYLWFADRKTFPSAMKA